MFNLGIIGKARAGKDSAAGHLIWGANYSRLSFAEALKVLALEIDPVVDAWAHSDGSATELDRLSQVVNQHGWESAKDSYPEVRRFLQRTGTAMRNRNPDHWVDIVRPQVASALSWNMPVVFTDVRYLNEAAYLRAEGFRLVRIVRPAPAVPGALAIRRGLTSEAAGHASETEQDRIEADVTIVNDGSLAQLHSKIELAARGL